MTTTTTDGSAWDELFLNPQKEALELGRQEGREAGLASGFQEGTAIGIVKGIEYGMEVGFMRGVAKAVVMELSTNRQSLGDSFPVERIQKTVADLLLKLDAFPTPNEIFQVGSSSAMATRNVEDGDLHQDGGQPVPSWNPSDLVQHMQGIRSKFKLLTMQLRWQNYSLKSTLDSSVIPEMENLNLSSRPDSSGRGLDW